MIKQLQAKVVQLEQDNQLLHEQLENNRSYYEDVIRQLTNENDNLRKFIDDKTDSPIQTFKQSMGNGSPTFDKANTLPQKLPVTLQAGQNVMRTTAELEKENASLRKQLSDMTKTYLDQIEQMNSYFVRIKQNYIDKVSNPKESYTDLSSEQLKKFMDVYDKIMKEFDEERKNYLQKIEELTNYIVAGQQREKEMQKQAKNMRLQLQIVKQQLKIYKRSKLATKSVIA